jgi:hypothetical protein
MKKILFVLMVALLSTSAIHASKARDLKKGQKIFKKKFRSKCGFSGVRFARYHTQMEWEDIWDDGMFQKEAKKICPRLKLKKIKKKWWPYVYKFTHEYAKDSSHVPHC